MTVAVSELMRRAAVTRNGSKSFLFWERSRRALVSLIFSLLILPTIKVKADIFVPADFPTVQSAINAAASGEVIHLAAGRYPETLVVNKSLTLAGSGTNNCVIHASTNIPLVSINGPVSVCILNLEINGGQYFGGNYNGTSFQGIVATNANLILNSVVLNQIINSMVTVVDGSVAATNVALWTRPLLVQCDIGFELSGCTGVVSGLVQDGGRIDHTININGVSVHHSDVLVEHCRIRTSTGSYGNCIRTYVNSNVKIADCYLYRAAGETVPSYPAFNHSGISVNGYSNIITIAGNTLSNIPWAMYFYGSAGLGGNQILIESNAVLNSPIGGIALAGMNYKGVDLGGGNFGSRGGNVFSQTPGPPATFHYDVLFTNAPVASSANVFAMRNTWSNSTNREAVIWDKLDDPNSGRLITDELLIKVPALDVNRRPVLTWIERGAGEQYTVEVCSDVASASWTPAPGAWPIVNSGLGDNAWTNSSPLSDNTFYRIRSVVP